MAQFPSTSTRTRVPPKPARGPECGHSACAQHFIDSGSSECCEPRMDDDELRFLPALVERWRKAQKGDSQAAYDLGVIAEILDTPDLVDRIGVEIDSPRDVYLCPECGSREVGYERWFYPNEGAHSADSGGNWMCDVCLSTFERPCWVRRDADLDEEARATARCHMHRRPYEECHATVAEYHAREAEEAAGLTHFEEGK